MLACGAILCGKRHRNLAVLSLSLLGSLLFHLQFASTGWFYRYEAYLIAMALPLIGWAYSILWHSLVPATVWQTRWLYYVTVFFVVLLALWPLQHRAKESLERIIPASSHIYRQQFQMGHFLKNMYGSGVRVACNDLGAIAYFPDADILDLWGLGSIDVARAKRAGSLDSSTIAQLLHAHQPDVIMVYADWFEGGWPKDAHLVAEWTLPDNFFGATVSIYALSEEGAMDLKARLRAYEPSLPSSVVVRYLND